MGVHSRMRELMRGGRGPPGRPKARQPLLTCGDLAAYGEVGPHAAIIVVVECGTRRPVRLGVYPREEWLAMTVPDRLAQVQRYLENGNKEGPVASGLAASGGGGIADEYPCLTAFLTMLSCADGSPRRTATLTVFCEDGLWKANLNDRQHQRSLWATGETYPSLLSNLEERLTAVNPEWRKTRAWERGQKGR